jgi:hypothetical protein
MQRHHLYSGTEKRECEGSGTPAIPWDPDKCGDCLMYRFNTPYLAEACASVGIERGRDGGAILFDLLKAYHRNGHREPA